MATFAQIVEGFALNVITGDSAEEAHAAHFAEGYDGGHPSIDWETVPDGTKSGAKDNGDGTFTNPSIQPASKPKELTSTQFHALAASVVGVERLGDILIATRDSTNGNAMFAWQRYSAANAPGGSFVKSDVAELSAGLVALGLMEDDERADIIAAWPNA